MSEDDEDLPRLLGGRYRLEAVLGHGGMGVVYRGVDLMMKRPIAVKLIRAIDGIELDDEVAGRFLREAKNTARVQHPHIVQVFDLGRTDEGALYLVMELLSGESLSELMRREGAMSPGLTVHIARQICEALQVAHDANVIHRDLKPANVMLLSRAGDDTFVKVLDFGVAKSYSPDQQTQLTSIGMLVGTVDYMAPEQIMSKAVDGRADVYSLGIVLYKMLSGKAPFRDTGVPALIHAHLNTLPKPLIEVAPGVPNELDRVVLRCLAKNPERRFESMAELSRALVGAVPSDSAASRVPKQIISDDDNPTVAARPAVPEADEEEPGSNFNEATVKMDRTLGFKKPKAGRGGLPMTPRGQAGRWQRPPGSIHDDAIHGEPRTCVMCLTVNAAYARSCVACGVALAQEDQPRAQPRLSSGPPPAGPVTGPLPLPYELVTGPVPITPPYEPNPRQPVGTGPHRAPAGWSGPHPAPEQLPPSPPPRSMWHRFLVWTGLRGR
jgi:serine/threonine-protein kinase